MAPAVAEDYRTVRLSISAERPYGRDVTILDAESIAELIDDCTQLPTTLRDRRHTVDGLVSTPPWHVSEGCLAQVSGLDEYV